MKHMNHCGMAPYTHNDTFIPGLHLSKNDILNGNWPYNASFEVAPNTYCNRCIVFNISERIQLKSSSSQIVQIACEDKKGYIYLIVDFCKDLVYNTFGGVGSIFYKLGVFSLDRTLNISYYLLNISITSSVLEIVHIMVITTIDNVFYMFFNMPMDPYPRYWLDFLSWVNFLPYSIVFTSIAFIPEFYSYDFHSYYEAHPIHYSMPDNVFSNIYDIFKYLGTYIVHVKSPKDVAIEHASHIFLVAEFAHHLIFGILYWMYEY